MKTPGQLHFLLKASKRFNLQKNPKKTVVVAGELAYNTNLAQKKPIERKGKEFKNARHNKIPVGVTVKNEKLQDVENLLTKHFGTQ